MKKVSKNYIAPSKIVTSSPQDDISEYEKKMISKLVDRAFAEYGETIRRLGDA
ncbi:MAG: hypothetical protein UT33_C0008G0050 [Candidatus Peregrinibacteria bacterium GW2011_GWC2_39_14]|nr:MAG: hypothetical protein US92_C0004G0050 [Candidatus Peregrinibacteria bacterium GW2011_GWA2_38_36]KKR06734.1 MAG: hypothetical protein UT33_C0008G0050 [Candidatus Peregrinibacteria bacterium GW2011_GWC2_39_14]